MKDSEARWEHFAHGSDIGVRGIGPTKAAAFEQVALALTGVITDPSAVHAIAPVEIACDAPSDEHLLVDMSRHQAVRQWKDRQLVDELARKGILIRSPSSRGVAEEAPGAYKDVTAVVDAADRAGLSRTVARLEPLVCVKG